MTSSPTPSVLPSEDPSPSAPPLEDPCPSVTARTNCPVYYQTFNQNMQHFAFDKHIQSAGKLQGWRPDNESREQLRQKTGKKCIKLLSILSDQFHESTFKSKC